MMPGTADPLIRYEGGPVAAIGRRDRGRNRLVRPDVDYWRGAMRCAGRPKVERFDPVRDSTSVTITHSTPADGGATGAPLDGRGRRPYLAWPAAGDGLPGAAGRRYGERVQRDEGDHGLFRFDGRGAVIASLLIANRGEIACRIIRTARRLGVRTVAVYSDADAKALHVREADEAVHIGPSPARESYLVGGQDHRRREGDGAEAIHPGYGFLSRMRISPRR
jgi:hypothetical protein